MKAIGINRAEVMYRTGQYVIEPQVPARQGYEAAGIVEAVGSGVTEFAPGDRVVFSFDDIVQAHRYMESNNQTGKIFATL